jgi:hypothetical protein
MKTLLCFFLLFTSLACAADKPITFTDEAKHYKTLFANTRIRGVLEFGLGAHTRDLLNSCNKVISVEFVTHGYGPATMKQCLADYKTFSNWIPIVFFTGYQGDMNWAPYKYCGSEAVYKATSYQASTHKNYAYVDDFYLVEMNAFMVNLLKCHKLDLAVVDGAFVLRGDLVQLLFQKIPIILAESTGARETGEQNDVYGFWRMIAPDNYEEIYFAEYATTIWVIKNEKYQDLIQKLKECAACSAS